MNNATVERIEIKMRGDNVYDIYVNKQYIGNAGCYLVALEKVKNYIERNDEPKKARCSKCVYELHCSKDKDNERNCLDYKRDAPDGGYYG